MNVLLFIDLFAIHLSTLPRKGRIDDGIYIHISYKICYLLLFCVDI
jgi:hypothetical protein